MLSPVLSPSRTISDKLSPSNTLVHSSPELPPLQSFTFLHDYPCTPRSDSTRPRKGDKQYYTASWGSPYSQPLSNPRSQSGVDENIGNDDLESGSPDLRLTLTHLLPSRTLDFITSTQESQSANAPLSGRDTLASVNIHNNRRSIRQQNKPLDIHSDQNTPIETALRQTGTEIDISPLGERCIDFGEGLGSKNKELFNAESRNLGKHQDNTCNNSVDILSPTQQHQERSNFRKGHKSRRSNLTLRPEDFLQLLSNKEDSGGCAMLQSKHADPTYGEKASDSAKVNSSPRPGNEQEKPEVPPKDSMAGLSEEKASNSHDQSMTELQKSPITEPAKRVKRKLTSQKGKSYVVYLPVGTSDRRQDQHQPDVHPTKAVNAEKPGTRFSDPATMEHSTKIQSLETGIFSQNRDIYPDPADDRLARNERKYTVRISDGEEWENYVAELREQKLRALGVSTDNEQGGSSMSRQSSSQRPEMSFTPPLLNSLAINQPLNAVPSPLLTGSGVGLPLNVSSVSPLSSFGRSNSINQAQRTMSPFSPAFGFQVHNRLSPSNPSWTPPLDPKQQGSMSADSASPILNNMRFNSEPSLLSRRQSLEQQHQVNRPRSTLAIVPEAIAEEGISPKTTKAQPVDIVVPTPRGHRHNISATLEKDIENAEYHLEKEIDRQLGEGGEFDSTKSDSAHRYSGEEFRNKAPSFEARTSISASKVTNGNGGDSNSTEPSPVHIKRLDQDGTTVGDVEPKQWATLSASLSQDVAKIKSSTLDKNATGFEAQQIPKASKPEFSFSNLNADAHEFSLPTGRMSLEPSQLSSMFEVNQGKTKPSSISKQSNKANIKPMTAFNVAAPSFTPSQQGFGSNLLTGEFNFSSAGPAFKPDAPEFIPRGQAGVTASSYAPHEIRSIAQRGIDYKLRQLNHGGSKFFRAPKAAVFVQPDKPSDLPLDQEDDVGRVTRADDRQKRARRSDKGGDDVPRFALHPQLLGGPARTSGDKIAGSLLTPQPKDKENIAPESAVNSANTGSEMNTDDNYGLMTYTTSQAHGVSQKNEITSSESFNASRDIGLHPKESTPQESEKPSMMLDGYESDKSKSLDNVLNVANPRELAKHSQNVGIEDSTAHDYGNTALQANEIALVNHVEETKLTNEDKANQGLPEAYQVDSNAEPTLDLSQEKVGASSVLAEKEDVNATTQDSKVTVSSESGRSPFFSQQRILSGAPSPSLSPCHAYSPPKVLSRSDISEPVDSVSSKNDVAKSPPIGNLMDKPENSNMSVGAKDTFMIDGVGLVSKPHVDSALGTVFDEVVRSRIDPLENILQNIQSSLRTTESSNDGSVLQARTRSVDLNSDADDEDDEPETQNGARRRAPISDRKLDAIKTIVAETVAAERNASFEQLKRLGTANSRNADEINERFAFHNSKIENLVSDLKSEVKTFSSMREHLSASSRSEGSEKVQINNEIDPGSLKRLFESLNELKAEGALRSRVEILENQLRDADLRAEYAKGAKETAERQVDEMRDALLVAQTESALLRGSANESVRSRSVHRERSCHSQSQSSESCAADEDDELRKEVNRLTAESEALSSTLDEYRESSTRWRSEIDHSHKENETLRGTLSIHKAQLEDALRMRDGMNKKLESLQQDLLKAVGQAASEKAQWQRLNQDNRNKYDILLAQHEVALKHRERLERQSDSLEIEGREALKLKIMYEQAQKDNNSLNEMITYLRMENAKLEALVAHSESVAKEAKENGHAEAERVRILSTAETEVARGQAVAVRDEMQNTVSRLQSQLDKLSSEYEKTKSTFEERLRDVTESEKIAVREVVETKNAVLADNNQIHEQYIKNIKSQYRYEMDRVMQDKERFETHHNEDLRLAREEIAILKDEKNYLNDKLQVSQSAAQAAAAAAQNAKSSPAKALPEKVSPQALRETVQALQEQLQEKEQRIDRLESEITSFDKDAPTKLKEREAEVTWLRELFGVRVDDLTDLVNTLSENDYDRDAARDAAIRLRASLQMELQERERLMAGGHVFPSLPNVAAISNFASPKAAQLAAAIGNWRKGKETSRLFQRPSSVSSYESMTPVRRQQRQRLQRDPSAVRTSPSQHSHLSGLMTPPASNFRRTPDTHESPKSRGAWRPHNSISSDGGDGAVNLPLLQPKLREKHVAAPVTPPLLGNCGYDDDAEYDRFSISRFQDDGIVVLNGGGGEEHED